MNARQFLLTTIILCSRTEAAQVSEVVDIVLYDEAGNVITDAVPVNAGSNVAPKTAFEFFRWALPSQPGDYLLSVYISNHKDEVDSDERILRMR